MAAIGFEIVRLDEVDSTNTAVLANPAYLERHGLVVLARHQTGGRGRMGRQWASVPGRQLQFSLALHPVMPAEDLPLVALIAGMAVAGGIATVLGLSARLKWPNDVLLNGRKVCGILVEGKAARDNRPRLVVGIGINCGGGADGFPPELRERLTTLEAEAGRPVDAEAVLHAVLERLNELYERLAAGDKPALLAEWRACALLGEGLRVRVSTLGGDREGMPLDLTPEGHLIVRLLDGSRIVQVSGNLDWLE